MLPFNNEKNGDKRTAWPMAVPEGGQRAEFEVGLEGNG